MESKTHIQSDLNKEMMIVISSLSKIYDNEQDESIKRIILQCVRDLSKIRYDKLKKNE